MRNAKEVGPEGSHWSPLKGAWVNYKGHIVKEGTPSKSKAKGVIAFSLVGILLGYLFVGSASSKSAPDDTAITKTVVHSGDAITFTQIK
jgi:hypothetical protein